MLTTILTIIASIASILPTIINAVQTGKIQSGAEDEVLAALSTLFAARVAAANAATETTDETADPANRDNAPAK
jgi:Na+-translocating ferredoxin:NAD+ oxidoreductase RnfG subunit